MEANQIKLADGFNICNKKNCCEFIEPLYINKDII